MDHDPLTPLFSPLTTLKGVGPTVGALIAKAAGGERVIDLLFHLPESYLDRRQRPTIAQARPGQIATLAVEVVRHEPPANQRQPWRVVVTDGTGFAELVFFKFNRERQMPVGAKLLVSGKVELFSGRRTMPHPEHVVPADRPELLPAIEPVWPLTGGLWPRQVANAMAQALARLPSLPEWHDAALLRREKWPAFAEALRAVQAPDRSCPATPAGSRLAYDELLADQVALAVVRGRLRARRGRALDRRRQPAGQGAGAFRLHADRARKRRRWRRSMPTWHRIDACCGCCKAMSARARRVVALLAMLRAVEAGKQAAHDGADRGAGEAASPHAVAPVAGARRVADRRREGARAGAVAARSEGWLGAAGRRHARAVPGQRRIP